MTTGSKWGCIATILVGCSLLFLSVFVALGDCPSESRCPTQSTVFVILLPIGIAAVAGLAVRWLINRVVARRDHRDIQGQ